MSKPFKKPEAQSLTSKNTSINSRLLPKIYQLVAEREGFKPGEFNLDIGGGRFDNFSEKLADEHGTINLIYDPFNRSEKHNEGVLKASSKIPVATVTCSNVLNVIKEDKIREDLIRSAYNVLEPDGVAYFTIYEGDRTGEGRQTGPDQYQLNRTTKSYIPDLEEVFDEVTLKKGLLTCRKGGADG